MVSYTTNRYNKKDNFFKFKRIGFLNSNKSYLRHDIVNNKNTVVDFI